MDEKYLYVIFALLIGLLVLKVIPSAYRGMVRAFYQEKYAAQYGIREVINKNKIQKTKENK